MMHIIYLHGFASSPMSTKAQFLAGRLAARGLTLQCPDLNQPDFQPEVAVELTTDTTPIPWSSLQAGFQPPYISTAAWNAMFPNLEAQVGSAWGDFVQRLDAIARLGHPVAFPLQ